ncbi:MAG: hypothetical protein ACOVQ2_07105 [Flavobacterium sp.]
MKYSLYIFSFFLLLKPVFPVITYLIGFEHISKELCENIKKPQLNCNGKCYLVKELANASEDEKPISDKKNQKFEIENLLFIEKTTTYSIISLSIITQNNYGYNNLYQYNNSNQTFHPPSIFI